MDSPAAQPRMPESFLEHRHFFTDPWVERWTVPNPFILGLAPALRTMGVDLGDFSFSKGAANVGESCLNVSIPPLNAAVRIGLATVTFVVRNPCWEMAPRLVFALDLASGGIRDVVGCPPNSQEATLAFHVTPGTSDFAKATASLVNKGCSGRVSLLRSFALPQRRCHSRR